MLNVFLIVGNLLLIAINIHILNGVAKMRGSEYASTGTLNFLTALGVFAIALSSGVITSVVIRVLR